MGIDPDAFSTGSIPEIDGAGAWGEIVIRILGIDPALDGVTARLGIEDVLGHWHSGSNADLLFDELTAHDFLRHRMLHLNPGVHFHEVEIRSILIDEIFDGAGILVADRFDQLLGSFPHALAEFL